MLSLSRTLALGSTLALLACAEGSGNVFGPNGGSGTGVAGSAGQGGDAGDGGSSGSAGSANAGSGAGTAQCNAVAATGESAVTALSPRISLGRPIFGGGGVTNPGPLLDGDYHRTAVSFGQPSPEAPAWVAIELVDAPPAPTGGDAGAPGDAGADATAAATPPDVTGGPTRLLVVWKDAGWEQYTSAAGGAPADYRLEVSSDSTNGADGSWTEVASVTDNPVNNRAHAVDFAGRRWLKLSVTRASPNAMGNVVDVRLDEITVHDASASPSGVVDDSWVFFGDSITQLAFRRDIQTPQMFDAQSQERLSGRFPPFVNAGVGGDTLPLAQARLEQLLDLNADMKYVAVGFGTNDAWNNTLATSNFEANLRQLVVDLQQAGKVPLLARIPFAGDLEANPAPTHVNLPAFNAVIDALQAELGLPCGPDLYELFRSEPSGLGSDQVHPNLTGYASMNALWADSAAALYDAD